LEIQRDSPFRFDSSAETTREVMDILTAILNALTAIAQLPGEIRALTAAYQKAQQNALAAKINEDTRPLEVGPTTDDEKAAAAKALASDIAHL
jgi:hypothetical protein